MALGRALRLCLYVLFLPLLIICYRNLQLPSISLCLWNLQDFSYQDIRSDVSGSKSLGGGFSTLQLSQAIGPCESNKYSLLSEDLLASWIQINVVYSLEACAICFQNLCETQTGFTVTILFWLVELPHQIHTLPQTPERTEKHWWVLPQWSVLLGEKQTQDDAIHWSTLYCPFWAVAYLSCMNVCWEIILC